MTRKPGKSTSSGPHADADASTTDADAPLPESLLDLPEGRMPTDSGEADDLLASLADDEIDRLTRQERDAPEDLDEDETHTGFAELTPDEAAALRAEGDDPPPAITEDSPEDDTVTSMPTDEELDALLRGEEPAADTGHLEVESASVDDEGALSDAAAELAAELDSQPENAGTAEAEAEDDADIVAADEAVEARKGINAVEPRAAVEEEPQPAAARKPSAVTPWFLKPLIWLNAPLARAPEPVRDLIGKVALITLLNAVAVFVYVFIIRR